jgi:hypothetical protein
MPYVNKNITLLLGLAYLLDRVLGLPIEMNITGTLPSDKLLIFFLKPNLTSRHACHD